MLYKAHLLRRRHHVFTTLALGALFTAGILLLCVRLASAQIPPDAHSFLVGGNQPQDTPTSTSTPACQVGWSIVSSPIIETVRNQLWGVGAVSSNDVWAVG